MNNSELVAQFNRNITRFMETKSRQRAEVHLAYQYRDGNQHETETRESIRRNKLITTVNLCAPMVRAVAGSEVMSASTLDFISLDRNFEADADIISDVVEWCQHASDFYAQRGIAAEDAVTCGLGCYVTYLDMTQKDFIAGVPVVERIFPNFAFYDDSCRGSQLNMKARYVGYADPVSREWLEEYIEENAQEDEEGVTDVKGHLLSHQDLQNYDDIDFLYHYFWYEFVDIYDVENPFDNDRLQFAIQQDADIANIIGETADDLQLDWSASYWTVDKEDYDVLRAAFDVIRKLLPELEIPDLEFSKRKGKCYYRAELGGGRLIKCSRSYTQSGHPLNFITGYFEESTGQYYGLMRPLSHIQDYLNIGMSDLLSYVKAASHGGSAYIKGAGDAFERIASERIYEDDLTPLPDGADVIQKATRDAPSILINFVTMMTELMPRVIGLGQEFFGVITSGDMTDSLYGKIMRQSFAVLENWKNNSANSDIRQARIFCDLSKMMAEANDGLILPVLSGDNKDRHFALTQQNLARNYAIRVVERPMNRDEKQEAFNKLIQLAPQMMQSGVNLYPVIARMAPFDKEIRDEMEKQATPQPPQPDPMAQALQKAQIAYTEASAQKEAADAKKAEADAAATMEKSRLAETEMAAEIIKARTQAEYNSARAAESMAKVEETFLSRMDTIEDRIKEQESVLLQRMPTEIKADGAVAAFLEGMKAIAESGTRESKDAMGQMAQAIVQSNEGVKSALTAPRKAQRDENGEIIGLTIEAQ